MNRTTLACGALLAASLLSQGCTGAGVCVHGENWKFKIGVDRQAGDVSLVPTETTIDALRAFPHVDCPADGSRIRPVEVTTWVLRDVEIRAIQRAPDGDVHMVLADANGRTVIAEATPPFCTAENSPWRRQISRVRRLVDREIPMVALGWRTWVISLSGVGYLDFLHGQMGAPENGIELHPVLSICFGRGCALPDPRE